MSLPQVQTKVLLTMKSSLFLEFAVSNDTLLTSIPFLDKCSLLLCPKRIALFLPPAYALDMKANSKGHYQGKNTLRKTSFHLRGVPCNVQAPFEILNKHWSQVKRTRSGKHGEPSQLKRNLESEKKSSEMGSNTSNFQALSAVRIVTIAGTKISKSKSQEKTGDFSSLLKSFGYDSIFTRRHAKHLKRVSFLLDAADKFSNGLYDQAQEQLMLVLLGSQDDHPIERVVTCFARDLRERIDVIRGQIDLEREVVHVDVGQALIDLKAAFHTFEQKLPFNQISHFTAVQTILDSVASAERIHFIDIGKKLSSYWIVMMHALANRKACKLEQLKITVVCTPKDNVEETGDLLSSFAVSMNRPFSFKILYSEMYELKKDQFELEAGETIAVYLEYCLISLADSPKNVERFLTGLKNLNPYIMVVHETDANTSASNFFGRFHEALFLCSAEFDCLEDCLGRENQFREIVEKLYFQEVIGNCVMSEDDESLKRCCNIDFWRDFSAKFGIVETELSQASVCQAKLMIRENACWSCCTISMNGNSMLVGWNGIPLRFVSAWKFLNKKL